MQVYVSGKSRYVKPEEVESMAHFFGKYLLRRLYDKVVLDVRISSEGMSKHVDGFCDWVDTNRKPRYFEIQVRSNISRDNFIRTLAHEMVHLKQYARGELMDHTCGKRSRWKDTTFYTDVQDYWELPWEIEAYGRERGLYYKYLQHELDINKTGALHCSSSS